MGWLSCLKTSISIVKAYNEVSKAMSPKTDSVGLGFGPKIGMPNFPLDSHCDSVAAGPQIAV